MIECIFILIALNLIMTVALCVREYEKQRLSSKEVQQFSKVMEKMEASPFQKPDWLNKLKKELKKETESINLNEDESGVIPGHLLEELEVLDEMKETTEERELAAEDKITHRFQQERGI